MIIAEELEYAVCEIEFGVDGMHSSESRVPEDINSVC